MNTNHTNTNNHQHMKERIMNKIHSIKNGIIETFMNEKKFDVFATVNICFFVAFLLFIGFAGRGGIIDGLLVCLAIWRILYYFINTKKSGRKRSFKDFFKATYTEDDFNEFKQDISKEMRIHCSQRTEDLAEMNAMKDSEKMDAFLDKHYRDPGCFYADEKDILSEAARYLVFREQHGMSDECTLKGIVKFFNKNKEEFLLEILRIHACEDGCYGGYRDFCLVHGLVELCTDKKALKRLRAKLRNAFTNSEVKLHDFEQADFARPGHILEGYNI